MEGKEPEEVETPAEDLNAEEPAETEDSPSEEEPAETVVPREDEPEPEPVAQSAIDEQREQFKRMKEDFGAEIASEVFESGGTYADALRVAYDRVSEENKSLKEQIESSKPEGGKPAGFSAASEPPKSLFKTGK